MQSVRRLTVAAIVLAALGGATATGAGAAEPFGQHVALCAHELGQRADAPAVSCSHDGMTMSFANFGAMVEHMRQMR